VQVCMPVQKMPTIQLYKNGEQGPEHIAAEGAIDALEKVSMRCTFLSASRLIRRVMLAGRLRDRHYTDAKI
jgi:hypothetical protein